MVVVSLFYFTSMPCFGQGSGLDGQKTYRSPARFEEAIQRFEAADREQLPPRGAIVCVGSSSMRGWHKTIQSDLSPLTLIPRGFGGSNMNDALFFADRIVLPYNPRAVIVYEGDNDIAQGIEPGTIVDTFQTFTEKIHKKLPKCRIYFISIKPSIKRWELWSKMKETNNRIAAECTKDERLIFVDVSPGMLDEEGKPRKEIFKKDDLHITAAGYAIWKNTLMPILAQRELRLDPPTEVNADEPSH